jgi:signal transduction histidine kinase
MLLRMKRIPLLHAGIAVGTLAVLALFSVIARRNVAEMQTLRDESLRISHTVEVQRELDGLLLANAQADSAARGYILTMADGMQTQFAGAYQQSRSRLDRLASLTRDNPRQRDRLPRLRQAVEELHTRLAAVVTARAGGSIEHALAQARAEDTAAARTEITSLVAAMEQDEARLLEERRARADEAYRRAVIGRVGSFVVSGALLVSIALTALVHARSNSRREQVLIESERRSREAAAREQEARAEAERVNAEKDQFLAVLSHELRTPLNAVLGWAQILQARGLEDPTVVRGLASIRRNAEAQQRLVEDLLDVSRIVADKLPLDRQRFDLKGAVAAAADAIRPSAEARGVVIQSRLDDVGTVEGDQLRIQQVVANLLANAVKFTPDGGRVEVVLTRQGEAALFEVRDTGVGFDSALAPHLFERFRQGDGSTTRAHGGLGLGLAIAKHIVDAHGGSIEAESAGRNHGATFRVHLPAD